MNTALNIVSLLLVLLGTYLLSKQLFIETIINNIIKTQLEYKRFEAMSIILRISARFYGINRKNRINIGVWDNPLEKKLIDLTAPFRGFIYILIGVVLQMLSLWYVQGS